jgi:K+-transporting ATPase ATPase C chain
VTLIAKVFFKEKSQGSLITQAGRIVGSELIAQEFKDEKYFHSRPSSTTFNTVSSGASNQSATHKGWVENLQQKMKLFPDAGVDAWTSSGSGLDPHISIKTAISQIPRILKARGWDENKKHDLELLILNLQEGYSLGFLGQPRINVLRLNTQLSK